MGGQEAMSQDPCYNEHKVSLQCASCLHQAHQSRPNHRFDSAVPAYCCLYLPLTYRRRLCDTAAWHMPGAMATAAAHKFLFKLRSM
jgi:hypothetical protein